MSITTQTDVVRVESYNDNVKKLGDWTAANRFEVRARGGHLLLDLRSPRIEGDIEIHVQAQRSAIKLLVPQDVVIDQWDLIVVGRGKVKDWEAPAVTGQPPSGRRIRLIGEMRSSEIRVNRGGVAILAAMFSREFVDDCVRAYREGGRPTIHDPADTHA
jgi:hypothetical protein